MRKKITLLNVVSNILLQFFSIISGFIIPKIVLSAFGSDVNGLVSSINQLLSYITLVEGGVTSVIASSLYKPLVNNDSKRVSSVIRTADKFYRKIGLLFIGYSLILAIIYPFIFNTSFSYIYILSLTIILSINLFIQYMFSLSLKTLLNADKKVYIVAFSQIIFIIANIIFSIIICKFYPSIHILKLISGSLYLIQPIIYGLYVKKHYKLDKNAPVDNKLIKDRWSGFAINLAAFIHFSTDTTILTVFTDLKTVSIYSIYSLITNGLKDLTSAIARGITPVIGQSYAKENIDELNEKMDIYEYIIFFLVFLLFGVAVLLISPFVVIYTNNITDTNYYQPLFGTILVIAEGLYILKLPHQSLAYSANKFREITPACFVEAFLNIVISTIAVSKLGLIGVALGTLIAMLFRLIYQVSFSKKLIKNRNTFNFIKKVLIFLIPTVVISYLLVTFYPIKTFTVIEWVSHAIIYTLALLCGYLIISIIFFKKEVIFLKKYLSKGGN